ncbi:MAG: arylsulfatase [Pirellulaceae bacterium]
MQRNTENLYMNVRENWRCVMSSCLLLLLQGIGAIGHAADRANVILVITDDQGYGDLGCHGNEVIQTPHLDQLYQQSVRLTDFHVSPLCTPTRAALMTGQNPVRIGAWGTTWGRSLPRREAVTMAEIFAAAGYRTGCFGKWHLGDNFPFRPQDRGFQEVLIHGGGGVGQAPDYWGNDYFDDTYFRNGQPEPCEGYCTDIWFDTAIDFIDKSRNEPFFCYLSTNAPHGPYRVDPKYSQPYKDQGVPSPMAEFYGMITNIDENMGRLMAHLETKKLAANTVLIFMTDNGTSAGFRGGYGFNAGMRGTKGSLYDGGHRVPCFLRWPIGGLTGGRDLPELAAHIDMIPTLADLCVLEIPPQTHIDGVSLAPWMLRRVDSLPDRRIFVQYRQSSEPPEKGKAAVLTRRWRLVSNRELYDIKADPGQTKNVAGDHAEVVEQLRLDYENWWADLSPQLEEFNHIVLGNDAENPARLSSFDWHTKTAWSQGQVRSGALVNSFWAVEIAREGIYEISLRRWPQEVNAPITAAIPGGEAIAATEARLAVADIDLTAPIPDGAPVVTFTVELAKGKTQLQTWLIDAKTGQSRGAYYVYVNKL